MELEAREDVKIYSLQSIVLATYLGGPLAAGMLVRRNCVVFGNEKQGLWALFIGIITTILLFVGIAQIPEPVLDKIPNYLIPFVYTAIIYAIVSSMHGKILRNYKKERNQLYSNWRAVGISLLSAIVTVIAVIGFVFLFY